MLFLCLAAILAAILLVRPALCKLLSLLREVSCKGMFKYFRPSWLEIKCCLREKSLTPTRFLVLLDFWDCRVRPFKANSWEGCCKRVTEHISMLICAVSTIMMIRKRNLLEGAPCPFYPHSQHSSTPVTSHHHMPIFCSFHPLSS